MTTETTTVANDEADVLSRLVQWHEAADQSTQDARTEAERDRDYYDGYQWTDDEVATLKKRKQPVVTINRIKPKVDFLKGQEQQRRMMPRAFPRTPAEEEGAQAATDSLRFVLDQGKWDRERSGCFDNHVIEGLEGVDIQVYQKPDGDYCIEAKQIPWDRIWYDPHSRQRDFSDAKYKGQFLWMDLEDALAKWSDKASILEGMMSQDSATLGETYDDIPRVRWTDPKRKRVRVAQCWSREEGKVYFSTFTRGGILERMESPFVDEDGEPDDGFVFGSCYIDRDGNRYGVVRSWISIQDEINKRRSKMLHLLSVRQTFGNQSIENKNEVRKELAKPDGHVELRGGAKFGEDFGILPTGDLAQGQRELMSEAKNEIDSLGVNAAMSGTEGRNMSGRALLARSEQGLAELQPLFDAFAQFQHDVYRKLWNRIRQFWTAEKWIRVTDDDKNVKFVGLNQPLTLGEQLLEEFKKTGAGPEEIAAAEQQAKMDPSMQVIVGVKNDVAKMDVDLVLDEVPASATLETETFEHLMQLAPHAGKMPPQLFEALLEASPLHGSKKEKVLKKLRGEEENPIPPQVQQQMQQAQAQIEQAVQIIQDLEGQLKAAQAQEAEAKAQQPIGEMEKKAQELSYREDMLRASEQIAALRIELSALKSQPTEPPPADDSAETVALIEAAKEIVVADITARKEAGEQQQAQAQEQGVQDKLVQAMTMLAQTVQALKAPRAAVAAIDHQRDGDGRLIRSVPVMQEMPNG
jgi:hypothetical protein